MTQHISEEYTDAVLACYHEARTIGADALHEAVVAEVQAVDDGAFERRTEVEHECKQLLKEREQLVTNAISEWDNVVDRNRNDREALERAQALTEAHLGCRIAVRQGEGCKFLDLSFTKIIPDDPAKCFKAVLRADGGFNLQSTEPPLQRDEEMMSKVKEANNDSSKLRDLVRFLRKKFVYEYRSD